MENTRFENIMKRVKEHYDEARTLGKEVVGVWLQGSQNYNLDTEQSDVDTKCIILPSFEDIVKGSEPYSHTHIRENNEHIDIKDIRVMIEMFRKQNNSYIEILFTSYFIINPEYEELVHELINMREKIARMHVNQALRCLAGMSMEKYKALEHPYPGTLNKIEKFGYDPKQLHHIVRLNDLMKKYIEGKPYSECLTPTNRSELIDIKLGKYSLEEARQYAKLYDDLNKELKNRATTSADVVDKETENFLIEIKTKFIRKHLISELEGN